MPEMTIDPEVRSQEDIYLSHLEGQIENEEYYIGSA
jgi:hypothetical protein